MSRYFNPDLSKLAPYVPGEQPKDREYIKLNTNESPFPPSPEAIKAVRSEEASKLNLYPDPEASELREAIAQRYGVSKTNVMCSNGSDEALAFAFLAFCGGRDAASAGERCAGAAFADVTYGFYPVYCGLYGIKSRIFPVGNDLAINAGDYIGVPETVFIANPNAHTGLTLPARDIEKIASSDKNRVVVVDEAYVDFGGESSVKLINEHKNILIIGTFSKSRSLAGGRLGFAIGDGELISDLNTVRYSFHPYNINRLTMAAGIAALRDEEYFADCVDKIVRTRDATRTALLARGFEVTDSKGNFLLAAKAGIPGRTLYSKLRETGILVRLLPDERIKDYIRVTIGSRDQMETFINRVDEILKG